jgi:hypothetical protein
MLLGLMVELERRQSGLAMAADWKASDGGIWCSKRGVTRASFIGGRVWRVEGILIHRIYLIVDPQIVDF